MTRPRARQRALAATVLLDDAGASSERDGHGQGCASGCGIGFSNDFGDGAAPAWAALQSQAPEITLLHADRQGRVGDINAAAAERLGGTAAQWRGRLLHSLLAAADAEWLQGLPRLAPACHGPRLLNLLDAEGHPHTVRAVVQVHAKGLTLAGVCTVQHESLLRNELLRLNNELAVNARELARQTRELGALVQQLQQRNDELALAHAEVARLARTDPLTGLLNRRALDEMLHREVERAQRKPSPLSVVVLDLDHFKRINDRWGHDAGDRLLVAVAALLLQGKRPFDAAVRMGGEEMLVLLPQTRLGLAVRVAERWRRAVAALAMPGVSEAVTASLGVAALAPGETAESLLQRADRALYIAKAAGRDRVVRAQVPRPAVCGPAVGPALRKPQRPAC